MVTLKKAVYIVSIVLAFTGRLAFAAGPDISFHFKTVETDHFYIHFHQGLEDLSLKAAAIAEGAHKTLTGRFHWMPAKKTHIVIVDEQDFLESFSIPVPYNVIYLTPTPPPADSALAEYDDWLRLVITHEYTHILTTDQSRGYSRVMRSIFGKPVPGPGPLTLVMFIAAAPPNLLLPDWWLEGVATWSETEYTGGGRGRSSYNDMVLRMAVYENNIPAIDKINGDVPYWPDGDMPYIFGLELQSYIARKYGSSALDKLSRAHSGRFPYFLNGAPEGILGKGYSEIYDEMVEDLKSKESASIKVIKDKPLTEVSPLAVKGEILSNPRYSPDSRLIAINRRDPESHEETVITTPEGVAVDSVRRFPSDHIVTWSPDGSRIYFSQQEIYYAYFIYDDLYSYDLKKKELKRLTHGMRVHDPDLSPDGRHFAVIVNNRGSQNLAIIDAPAGHESMDDNRPEAITDLKLMRVCCPRWSPDGKKIAYSVTDNSGMTALYIYDTSDKTIRKLFEGRAIAASPAWSKDGDYIIYSSNETKVYDLYACRIADGKKFQVTNVMGGAFQPDISKDGTTIIFSDYGSRGFRAVTMGYDPRTWKAYVPVSEDPARNKAEEQPIHVSEPRTFNPFWTLIPRFWLPTLAEDHKGAIIGAFTAAQDAVTYNAYTLDVGYGPSSGVFYYDAVFTNIEYYPKLSLEAHKRPVLYTDLLQRGNYHEINKQYTFEASIPLLHMESSYAFLLGYTWQKQEAESQLTKGTFNGLDVFRGKRSFFFTGIEFSNAIRYPYSISEEEGRKASLLYRRYSRRFQSDVSSNEYIASYSEFISPAPSLMHHVVYLNLKGGVSAGKNIAQQAFQLGGDPQTSDFPLRGFPSRFEAGKYITTATLEYRMPLRYIFEGPGTKPLFLGKLHGAVFTDAGEVWGDSRPFSTHNIRVGSGFEARMDMTVGYNFSITPALGIAHGFNQNGATTVYFTIYSKL